MDKKVRYFLLILPLLLSLKSPDFEKKVKGELDSFYDPSFDYSRFSGRVSDKDVSGNILKVHTENKNARFFKAGDVLDFAMSSKEIGNCQAYVRSSEKDYFVVYVKDFSPCLGRIEYLRRGTSLVFFAPILGTRVKEASQYRLRLMRRHGDFLSQLNGVNKFVFDYKSQELQLLAEFDKKFLELEKEKKKAISLLQVKKQNSMRLQRELMYRLDQMSADLEFYRIDKFEARADRWHLDHDLGLPVGARPAEPKQAKK